MDAFVVAAETISPEHSVLADERLKYLRAAVEALPEKMRYVVEEIFEPQSRITARRRHDYLSTLATATLGGITRSFAP